MNILKAVLKHEVFPALGCTEPIAIAYAASAAAKQLDGEMDGLTIVVDHGAYKNGFAVTIPNTGGEQGNLIAGVLGALIRRPELKMEVLSGVTDDILARAKALVETDRMEIHCDRSRKPLYVDVTVRSGSDTARAVIRGSHTNIVLLERNGEAMQHSGSVPDQATPKDFKDALSKKTVAELVDMARQIDDEDYAYLKRGIDMNLRISEAGYALKKVSHYVSELVAAKHREDDVFSSCEVMTSSAADARMGGLGLPVMSSGGSGNQGIVAILVPHVVGTHCGIAERTIIESIALSHLLNSYIKCFTGDLSPLCGCAIAAGVGAAAAIVYQQAGKDMTKIALAINNLVSDIGGMLCDGAKSGCALKVATSTNSAIRSAYMALNGHGITQTEGFVGETPEDTIRNLSKIGTLGMSLADDTMLGIMIDKAAHRAHHG